MVERIYLEEGYKKTYVCPKCHREDVLDNANVSTQQDGAGVKFTCPCGFEKMVYLEYRNFGRLDTDLPGTFNVVDADGNPETGLLMVKDLSMTGLKLKLGSSEMGRFKVGDQLVVDFNLDNESRSHIRKRVTLKYIKGHFCGVEFCGEDEFDNHLVSYYFVRKGIPGLR